MSAINFSVRRIWQNFSWLKENYDQSTFILLKLQIYKFYITFSGHYVCFSGNEKVILKQQSEYINKYS